MRATDLVASRWRRAAAAGVVSALAIPSASLAQELPSFLGWTLGSVRGGARLAPDYMGSDDYNAYFTGAVVLTRKNGYQPPFGAPDDGVSLGLLGKGPFTAGLAGRWRSARDADGDLQGFEEIDGTVEAGVFAEWWPADWLRFRAEARRGFGGHEDWVGDLSADAIARSEHWVLTAGPRISWGDSGFAREYFSVTPTDAARSPRHLTPFAPDDSLWAPGLLASASYRVTPSWSVETIGTYRRLMGDAADSPIVADLGSPDQFTISLSLRYTFGQ
jgi:MipA family protein